MGYINEAIDQGNPLKTLDALLLPTAKIRNVDPAHAQHYQDVLSQAKLRKLRVSWGMCSKQGHTVVLLGNSAWAWEGRRGASPTSIHSWCP